MYSNAYLYHPQTLVFLQKTNYRQYTIHMPNVNVNDKMIRKRFCSILVTHKSYSYVNGFYLTLKKKSLIVCIIFVYSFLLSNWWIMIMWQYKYLFLTLPIKVWGRAFSSFEVWCFSLCQFAAEHFFILSFEFDANNNVSQLIRAEVK